MLFAFEIGSALLVTAGLGFLGYYVGGEVWVWISDTQAARLSGMPELGQMLSSVNEDMYTSPWKLFASGTLILITVLGFNMLGEGLRRNANIGIAHSPLFNRLRIYLEETIFNPLKNKMQSNPMTGGVIVFTLITAFIFLANFISNILKPEPIDYSAPGEHLWANQWGDPTGTMLSNAPGIESPHVLWSFTDENGFSGGAVVNLEGDVFILSKSGMLYSLNPQGAVIWSHSIGVNGVGTPALDADGNVYVTDIQGRLSSFTSQGEMRWQLNVEGSFEATSGPVVGTSGKIYYVVIGDVRAISPDGELLWQTTAFSRRFTSAPIISPNEEFIF
ncbi:MAG: PQQ-binding-like beta-propeller repeat protein [Anaerolineales bacterium]|nr:PQQ-binding-like beta-propeller repeat protein [Anaerolineales bacterium]